MITIHLDSTSSHLAVTPKSLAKSGSSHANDSDCPHSCRSIDRGYPCQHPDGDMFWDETFGRHCSITYLRDSSPVLPRLALLTTSSAANLTPKDSKIPQTTPVQAVTGSWSPATNDYWTSESEHGLVLPVVLGPHASRISH
jgi:hypothetical protein